MLEQFNGGGGLARFSHESFPTYANTSTIGANLVQNRNHMTTWKADLSEIFPGQ